MPEHDESTTPEPGDAVERGAGATPDQPDATPDETTADEADQRPLSRFASRFRVPLGVAVAALGIVLGVLIATEPRDTTGVWAVVSHIAAVGVWVCVTAVGVLWAIAAPRRATNLTALAGVACYVVMLVTGL